MEARRERGDMIQTWKSLNNKEDVDPRTWFKMANENVEEQRIRSHRLDIYKPKTKLDIRTYFYSSRVTDQWNELPNHLKEASTINQFKNEYDKYKSTSF